MIEVFRKASGDAQSVVFFDELGSVSAVRGSTLSDTCGSGDRIKNELFSKMDEVGSHYNVFFIGATNRPDILDEALLRLDQFIYMPLSNLSSCVSIFKTMLRLTSNTPKMFLKVVA